MAGGTLSNSAGVVLTNDISLSSSGNFGVMTGTTEKFSGSISGTGALNKTDAGVLHLLGSNSYSGGTVINAGRLSISNGNALGTGTLTLNGGSTLFALSNSTQNVTITNNIALGAGANVLLSQDVNMTQVVSGVISGDGMMQKVNALGTLVLNGANTYTNTTSVGAGKMIVNGSLLSSLITVTGLATLSGTGTVEAVTVNAGGILSVGSSPGTMTFNGALTLGNGSTNLMEIFTTGSDVIKGNGANTLTMNGTTVLDFTGNTVADYTTLDLFKNWGSIVTNSTTTFTAVGLASGQSLDLSHLTTGGPITVIPEPATIGMLGLGALVTLLIRRMGARY